MLPTDDLHLPPDLALLVDQLPTLPTGQAPGPYNAGPTQDDLDELGAGTTHNTRAEAVRLGRTWARLGHWCGVGYCLRTIRTLYAVAPLYPDAETAAEHTTTLIEETDPARIPWGVPVWWVNGGYGHVALSVGDGRCLTTDYVHPGHLGVAPIAALAPWCHGRLLGWSRDINAVAIWPEQAVKPPLVLDLEGRRRLIRAALRAEKAGQNRRRRVDALQRWLDRIDHRIEDAEA